MTDNPFVQNVKAIVFQIDFSSDMNKFPYNLGLVELKDKTKTHL